MKYFYLCILFHLLLPHILFGKDRKLDSLFKAGAASLYNGNYDEAFNNFNEARKLSEELGDSASLAESLRYLGEAYRATRQFNSGITYLNAALEIGKSIGDSLSIAKTLNRLSALKFEQADIVSALELAQQSLSLSEQLSEPELSANNLNIIGAIHMSENKNQQAILYYNRSREILLTLGNQSDLPNILTNIANNYYKLGEYQKGLQYAEEAYELASKNQTLIYMLEASKYMKEGYLALGNLKRALEYSERASEINEELINRLQKVEQNAVKLRNQKELAEKENLLLKQINDENERSLKIQRMVFWFIIGGLVIVTGLLLLLLILYKQRKRNMQALREQNALVESQKKELQQLNELKNTLLSVISHDFRSPLVTLHATAQLLDLGNQSKEELTEISNSLQKHVNEALESLDKMIFWSKSQMEGFRLNMETFDLREFFGEVIKGFQPELQSKDLKVENRIPAISIETDREVLKIILRNLLSNAIKFSHPHDIISLNGEIGNSHISLSVLDHGIGMNEEVKQKLFSHEHITTPGTGNERGTGMGLILTRELIKKLGGKIHIDGEPGKGSTVIVDIPKR